MIRRMQLLSPEDRPSAPRLATLGERIRGALLHNNKVVPAVFAALALLVFVWVGVGALMGGDSGEEEASSQASLTQEEPEGGREPEGGEAETPAPEVENRDTDSYAAFDSKDPFHNPLSSKAGEGKASNGPAGDSKIGGDSQTGGGKAGDNGSARDGGARDGGARDGGARDGNDQDGGSRTGANGTARDGGARDGGATGGGDSAGQPSPGDPNFGGTGQGGSGDLFNSGGELPAP